MHAISQQEIPPLIEYVTKISPDFDPPHHMSDLADLFERARRYEPIRACISYPIRHYKTETVLHGLLWLLEHDPSLRIVLMTHSNERAMWLGKRLRNLARRVPHIGPASAKQAKESGYGSDTIAQWENTYGGGVLIMSADMSREGFECHVLLCDDPIDEKAVRTKEKRDEVDQNISYYTARCMRRGEPGPVIIVASRFDRDDPVGRRLALTKTKWLYLHQPAIMDLGLSTERAFAPDVWPLDKLKALREELKEVDSYERIFWSRLQGDPKVLGGSFGPPTYYGSAPAWPGFRDGIGFDLSFTRNKRSDHSAICVGRYSGGILYVLKFWRFQAELDEALRCLRAVRQEFGGAPVFSFMSGPEVAVARYLESGGMPVQYMRTSEPKFTRARRTIDAHNVGRIQYPKMDQMCAKALDRIQNWHGEEDAEDDEADALVSLWEGLVGRGSSGFGPVGVQARRMA